MKLSAALTALVLLGLNLPPSEQNTTSPVEQNLCYLCQCPAVSYSTKNYINCQNKGLTTIPAWDLKVLPDEVELSVQFEYNKLTEITKEMMPARTDVFELFFEANNISKIGAQAFCQLTSLRTLSLNTNSLTTIHRQAFEGCDGNEVSLTTLDLSNNQLHSLDDDLFDDLHQLRKLYLSENMFVSIDTSTATALNKLVHLTHLDLSRNKLQDLNSGISTPIKTLDYLNLAGNKLETVPEVLKYAVQLSDLNLNDNPIVRITEKSFKGLFNLQVLNISAMPDLEMLEERALQPLDNLRFLHCTHNAQLKYIHPQVFGKNRPSLYEVDLSENGIQTMDENVINWWDGDNLNLQANPLFCDCSWLWLKWRKVNPELMQEVRCTSGPPSLKDKLLIDVQDEVMMCEAPHNPGNTDGMGMFVALFSIATLAILVVVVAAIAILRQKADTSTWSGSNIHYTKASTDGY